MRSCTTRCGQSPASRRCSPNTTSICFVARPSGWTSDGCAALSRLRARLLSGDVRLRGWDASSRACSGRSRCARSFMPGPTSITRSFGFSERVSLSRASIPPGGYLIAVKHQSMFETLEMMRIARTPIVVLKRELSRMPGFGWATRRYGVIPVDRNAGAKALREMLTAGKEAVAIGTAGPHLSRRARGSGPVRRRRCRPGSPGSTRRSACPWCRLRWTAAGSGAAICRKAAERFTF